MKTLICLVGETARGKDTAARYLQDYYNLRPVCSYTTRPRRVNETEGKEHHFISDGQARHLLAMNDNIAAYTEIGEYKYFSTISELSKSDIYIIDPNGLKNLYLGNADIDLKIIYITSTLENARARAKKRGDDIAAFEERVIVEYPQFKDFTEYDLKLSNNSEVQELYKALDIVAEALLLDKDC